MEVEVEVGVAARGIGPLLTRRAVRRSNLGSTRGRNALVDLMTMPLSLRRGVAALL